MAIHTRTPRLDQNGDAKGALKRGEHKSLQTDRVILVPGPEQEIEVVRSIYRMVIEEGRTEREIADLLNTRGVLTDLGRPWARGSLYRVAPANPGIPDQMDYR